MKKAIAEFRKRAEACDRLAEQYNERCIGAYTVGELQQSAEYETYARLRQDFQTMAGTWRDAITYLEKGR